MEQLIRKILKESEFDWIKNVPSFIEITEPVSIKNPKNKYRLHWTNGSGEDYGTWSDNWIHFDNDNNGINRLTRYIKILQNGINAAGFFSIDKLVDLYLDGNHDYIVNDWMKAQLAKIPEDAPPTEERESLEEWLDDDLRDTGILFHDDYHADYATLERWWVTYFDENGIEFKTKINRA